MSSLALHITLDRVGRSLQAQLAEQLRTLMLDRKLRQGDRLPATRVLASDLGVSRNTVTAVYEQLQSEGFLEGRQGSGTRVAKLPPIPSFQRSRSQENESIINAPGRIRPGSFLFETGLPDIEAFPRAEWARVAGRVFRNAGDDLLHPTADAGHPSLRRVLVQHLADTRGIQCSESQIIVTNGAQAALDLVMRILLQPKSRCLVEDPSWPGFAKVAAYHRVIMLPVPVDADGLDLGAASGNMPAEMIFVTPSYQFPLGITMSLERRLELLDFAARNDCWVLEDDYDSDLRYRGKPLAALKSLDRTERVIYTGTFSKAMFPPIRIGYVVVPDDLVERFSSAIRHTGQQPSPLMQKALAVYIGEGLFARHLRRMQTRYRERQLAVVDALNHHAGNRIEVTGGQAGMQLVAWLKVSVDREKLRHNMLARGLAAHLLSDYYHGSCPREGLFLGYAALPLEKVDSACRHLAEALNTSLATG